MKTIHFGLVVIGLLLVVFALFDIATSGWEPFNYTFGGILIGSGLYGLVQNNNQSQVTDDNPVKSYDGKSDYHK